MEKKFFVCQDGAQFYLHSDSRMTTDSLITVVSYPKRVGDFDMVAAVKARKWFNNFAKENNWQITWE